MAVDSEQGAAPPSPQEQPEGSPGPEEQDEADKVITTKQLNRNSRVQLTRGTNPRTGLVLVVNIGDFALPVEGATLALATSIEKIAEVSGTAAYVSGPWKPVWPEIAEDAKAFLHELEPRDLPACLIYRGGRVVRLYKHLNFQDDEQRVAVTTAIFTALQEEGSA